MDTLIRDIKKEKERVILLENNIKKIQVELHHHENKIKSCYKIYNNIQQIYSNFLK